MAQVNTAPRFFRTRRVASVMLGLSALAVFTVNGYAIYTTGNDMTGVPVLPKGGVVTLDVPQGQHPLP